MCRKWKENKTAGWVFDPPFTRQTLNRHHERCGKYGQNDDEEVDIDDLMNDTENASATENTPETPETTEINGEKVTE